MLIANIKNEHKKNSCWNLKTNKQILCQSLGCCNQFAKVNKKV